MDWQPSAKLETLRKRAAILSTIRRFFTTRKVLEVETPALSAGTVTDVHLEALQTQHPSNGHFDAMALYLQTSPEYAMKRMLAAGYPDIFQICKCFREDEVGTLHNPEFTMLEWYRRDFAMQNLIDEVGELLIEVLGVKTIEQCSYQKVFVDHLQLDPFATSIDELLAISAQKGLSDYAEQLVKQGYRDTVLFDALLQVLFSQEIEPRIGQYVPVCISHFPHSQAALAKLEPESNTALRFEFYYKGVELANGFEELSDPNIQAVRFEQDNEQRSKLGKPAKPIDFRFMNALRAGLPNCSGVAMGIDRLIMLALDCESISEVISFDIQRA
ncbi:elongation factor P--(R)-beta-lysine ligase [Glaciecola sp. SC05]|uniref:elongation factor P--(R)-beta-lysine ligase n=1 Tax=Glaciecola sp. SC05 TaxID=1987355 RepID=UPI003528D60A